METESPKPAPSANVVPLRPAGLPGPTFEELLEQALRIALGLAAAASAAVAAAVTSTMRPGPADEAAGSDDEPVEPTGFPLLAGAVFGLALEGGRLAFGAAEAVATSVRPWISFLASPNVVRRRLEDGRILLRTLDDRWHDEGPEREEAASAFVRGIVPQIVEATLNQLDLTQVVLSRVDLDEVVGAVDLERVLERIDLDQVAAQIDVQRIIDRVDLNEVAARIDVERIVDRVDLNAIVERVDVQRIIDRVDLNEVAARIDVDAVASRIDLDRIVGRIDLVGIARYVIEELDLTGIIRESTETITTETVEGIRVQGMNADRLVSRLLDRALGRREERADDAPDDREDER